MVLATGMEPARIWLLVSATTSDRSVAVSIKENAVRRAPRTVSNGAMLQALTCHGYAGIGPEGRDISHAFHAYA